MLSVTQKLGKTLYPLHPIPLPFFFTKIPLFFLFTLQIALVN
ncbi:putative membrane protein [Vibrio cholerae O1 str. 116063]|nr:putative membrane protein [Vibrio cholerae O1 str. 116063]